MNAGPGRVRTAARFCSAALIAVLLPMAIASLVWQSQRPDVIDGMREQVSTTPIYIASQLGFLAAAVVIMLRRPGNLTGWLFACISVSGLAGGFFYEYALRGTAIDPGSLALAAEASVAFQMTSTPIVGWFILTVLTFPDGRLPGPRWRAAVAIVLAGFVSIVASGIALWPHRGAALLAQELRVDGIAGILWNLPYALFVPVLPAALIGITLRYRRSRGEERQQLKWFVFGVGMSLDGTFIGPFRGDVTGEVIAGFALCLIPLATAIAILKYRLYDIDVIINRALVYSVLSAALVIFYLTLVFALQTVLPLETDSDLAVAGSTLAAAALFQPLKTRIQSFIDRRFYRSKYDAALTLEALGQRLRDEVDLSALEKDVMSVVGNTMQPRHVSMWVRT